MENTTTQRMVMRVRLQDVSDRSTAIEYVGQGTWFDEMNAGIGNEIWHLNPDNGNYSGKTYVYSKMTDKLYDPYAISPVKSSPAFLFEIR